MYTLKTDKYFIDLQVDKQQILDVKSFQKNLKCPILCISEVNKSSMNNQAEKGLQNIIGSVRSVYTADFVLFLEDIKIEKNYPSHTETFLYIVI